MLFAWLLALFAIKFYAAGHEWPGRVALCLLLAGQLLTSILQGAGKSAILPVGIATRVGAVLIALAQALTTAFVGHDVNKSTLIDAQFWAPFSFYSGWPEYLLILMPVANVFLLILFASLHVWLIPFYLIRYGKRAQAASV
jgi:hypothetical protein